MARRRYWMDAGGPLPQQLRMASFRVDKLSDEFGQYTLIIRCAACQHERVAAPTTLARLCGWDTPLSEVAKRMRCSKCNKKNCSLRAVPPRKPRGYQSLPH